MHINVPFALHSIATLKEKIRDKVDPILRKSQYKRGETKESLLKKAHDELKAALLTTKRLPPGTLQKAVDQARTDNGLGQELTTVLFQKCLGTQPAENINVWLNEVKTHMEDEWEEAIEGERGPTKRPKLEKQETHTTTVDQTRTCTATLRQLLRFEVAEKHDEMAKLADKCQEEITTVVDELSVLTLKATMAVS